MENMFIGEKPEDKYKREMDKLAKIRFPGLLSDREIKDTKDLVITPFAEGPCPPDKISYGLTSFGYDIRINNKYLLFSPAYQQGVESGKVDMIDPKKFDPHWYAQVVSDYCVIPPNSFALAESLEYLEIPRDVLGLVVGKSTIARTGLVTPLTPLEPEWKGTITLELCNTTQLPIKVYSYEGICQVLFFRSTHRVDQSYKDKRGTYQQQSGITGPKVRT